MTFMAHIDSCHPWSDLVVGCGTLFQRDGIMEGFHPES